MICSGMIGHVGPVAWLKNIVSGFVLFSRIFGHFERVASFDNGGTN